MTQPLYTVLASSEAWPFAGSQAERALNRGYLNDAHITSTGGETANISPSTASQFTSTGDQTEIYKVSRRLRVVHGASSTDTTYCEVSAASFGGGVTTVTIRNITAGATALSTAAIGEVGVSPIWSSSSGGNVPMSTGSATSPTWTFWPYAGSMGMYASSSSIMGFSVAGTTIVTIGATYLAIGASPATAGPLRIPNNTNLTARDAANGADIVVIGSNASDRIIIDSSANGVVIGSGAAGGWASLGATPATAGQLRLTNAQGVQARNAANAANLNVVQTDGTDRIIVGDTGSALYLQASAGNLDIRYATTAVGLGATCALGGSSGSGPTVSNAQDSWLKLLINGTTYFIPTWR